MNEPNAKRSSMKAPLLVGVVFVIAAVGGLTVFAWQLGQAGAASEQKHDAKLVDRGRYLVTIAGCNDCHTPFKMTERGPAPDMSRMLSGHPEAMKLGPAPKSEGGWMWHGAATNTAFAGPWGKTYAANLTPDRDTGLGLWTEEMFINAIRTGKHFGQPGARSIQPPMPWPVYAQMTDMDLKAVWAYLRTISPINNAVHDFEPPAENK